MSPSLSHQAPHHTSLRCPPNRLRTTIPFSPSHASVPSGYPFSILHYPSPPRCAHPTSSAPQSRPCAALREDPFRYSKQDTRSQHSSTPRRNDSAPPAFARGDRSRRPLPNLRVPDGHSPALMALSCPATNPAAHGPHADGIPPAARHRTALIPPLPLCFAAAAITIKSSTPPTTASLSPFVALTSYPRRPVNGPNSVAGPKDLSYHNATSVRPPESQGV
jgi:hypothetical protein